MRRYLPLAFCLLFFLISEGSHAQPETLLNPVRAMQGYTGESYCQTPVSELAFEEFLSEMRSLPNDRLRFEKVRTQIHELCLATPYVFRMMELMENAGYEYDMMRISFYYCADPENYDRLLPFMQGSIYRNGMEAFLQERVSSRRPDVEGQRQLMSPSEMTRAMEIMEAANSDQSKLAIATEIVNRNNLLSEQVSQLVDQINLISNKKELCRRAYQVVYDPANFFLVYEGLSRRDRQAVMSDIESIRRPDTPMYMSTREIGCTYRVMESEFVSHLNSLEAQRRSELKLKLAQQLFENNCFNVSELRRAMRLFVSDQDRLELAKAAEAFVFDPWNIYMVNAEFQRSSSVDAYFNYLRGL